MRPKRIILLVDDDENRQAETRFMLLTAGFKVLSSVSSDSARKNEQPFDVVLSFIHTDWTLLDSLAHRNDVRLILVCPTLTGPPGDLFADSILLHGGCSPANIIEKVKFAVARKRGPKRRGGATLNKAFPVSMETGAAQAMEVA